MGLASPRATGEPEDIAEIRHQRDHYAAIFDAVSLPLSVLAALPGDRFVYDDANQAHGEATGVARDRTLGRPPEAVLGPDAGAAVTARARECLESGQPVEVHSPAAPDGPPGHRVILTPFLDPSDATRKILITTLDAARSGTTHDGSPPAPSPDHFVELTSELAHDFNNLLTSVLGNIELARRRPNDPGTRLRLETARAAAARCGQLTERLLAAARRQQPPMRGINVRETVRGMADQIVERLGGLVEIVIRCDVATWHARTDALQFELAILNLALNARDAMVDGGRLTITTSNIDRTDPRLGDDLAPGDYVAIAIADTGTGMPQAVIDRAFEPFFTTKMVGQGTGLGLAQVVRLARQSGGTARLASTMGAGTTVTLYLPRAEPAAAAPAMSRALAATAPMAASPVLIIDDDPDVRAVAANILADAGYEVREAESGVVGLALMAGERIGTVLVDFAMPGLSGPEFLRLARARFPGLRAAYITGYRDPVRPEAGDKLTPVIEKPYNRAELLAVIADLASRSRPP